MNRSDFLKVVGLGASGLIAIPNSNLQAKPTKIYDNYITGLSHYKFSFYMEEMKVGDDIILIREGDNRHDRFAIQVFYQNEKIGYIPFLENMVLANMLDVGVSLQAKISCIDLTKPIYKALSVSIYTNLITSTIIPPYDLLTNKSANESIDEYRTILPPDFNDF